LRLQLFELLMAHKGNLTLSMPVHVQDTAKGMLPVAEPLLEADPATGDIQRLTSENTPEFL